MSDSDSDYEVFNISPGEWAVIGIGIVFHFINLCGLVYVLYNRKYPPLRIKQLDVVTCNLITAIVWWIGAIAVLRILPQVGNPVFLVCSFWAIWVQLVFGIWFWLCTHIFRVWKLFVIVKLKRSTSGYGFYSTFLIFWGPGVVYGIIASILKVDGPLDYEGYYQCHFIESAMYVVFAILAFDILCVLYFFFAIRSVSHNYLHEYKELRNLWGIMICFYSVYVIILCLNYQLTVWGRCVASLIVLLCGSFSFWFIVGAPIYHCLFRHEKMLKQFHNNYFHASSTSEPKSEEIEMT